MDNSEKALLLKKLEKYGIQGKYLYLANILPLIEIAWSDGRINEQELQLLQDFLKNHIKIINEKVGADVITYKDASNFLMKYLKKRPSQSLLKTLRTLALSYMTNDSKQLESDKLTILKYCLDIGSCCVLHYPYGIHERFSEEEKKSFIEIMKELNISPNQEA